MKKNGFTLVEIIAVFTILVLIGTIVVVAVNTTRKKQEEKNMRNVVSGILTGAKQYIAESPTDIDNDMQIDVNSLYGKYTKFDKEKYDTLLNNYVVVSYCSDNELKLEYSIMVDGDTYTDCGCENQDKSNTTTDLCTN